MRAIRSWAAVLTLGLAACTGSSGSSPLGSSAPAAHGTAPSAPRTCPTDSRRVAALLREPITHVEGATPGSTEQVCSFSTSTTDIGALSVVYLRFPRPELGVKSLAGARRLYGSPLSGHTVVSMPSWGRHAFLDESMLPGRDLVAEFAWVPGFEIILGMHSTDRHVAQRRQLIERLVALTR